jgi:eukaryotic-like serine/threonine-protein kinase
MSQLPQFTPASPYPLEGEVLDGKYRVEKLLGEGGMGAVAKATHLIRRAPVALKFMSPAVLALQGAVERFVNEGVAASQIESDHVVKVFDVGRLPSGAPYLVMEFLPGQDLAQILEREGGRLSIPRAVHFTIQILRALQTAHAAGIIHRDMKPSNCFVIDKDGEPDFVKLVDFGISKVRSDDAENKPNLTRTNSALGTPLYMSPEQARSPRDVDQRSDLYSVGAILYETLAGRTPYTSDTGEFTEILYKIFTTDPEPLVNLRPDVPPELAAVVTRALTRDLNVRFPTAVDFAEALAPFSDERSANEVSRLRGGRGRSIVPAPPAGAMMSSRAPAAPNFGDAATAATFPGTPQPGLAPPKVPTDIGVTKDAAPSVSTTKPKKTPVVLGIAAVAILTLSAGTVLVMRRNTSGQATQEPPSTATTTTVSAPPPPASTLPPAAIPSASLAPLATGAPSASASVTPPSSRPPSGNTNAGNNGAPGTPATPGNKPPSTLGGIQLH